MSRFGRHLKNRMLRFPAQILPMMGFSSCDDSDVFQRPKLVSIGGSYSEPFSHLQWSRNNDRILFLFLFWLSMDDVCHHLILNFWIHRELLSGSLQNNWWKFNICLIRHGFTKSRSSLE